MSTGYVYKSVGYVIHCVRGDREEFIDFTGMARGVVIRFSATPVIYTKEECEAWRKHMVEDSKFDTRPYPYGVDKWQTAEVVMLSKY